MDLYGPRQRNMPGRFTCDGIGFILSQKLSNGLEVNKADMLETIKHIRLIKPVTAAGKLFGKSFCFTGAMEYKRKDLQDMVTANGGTQFHAGVHMVQHEIHGPDGVFIYGYEGNQGA